MKPRGRHISTRPVDEPIFTKPTSMDFEKRRLIVPPGTITYVFGDQMRQTEKTTSFTAGNETVILAYAATGKIEITLPAASAKPGKWYWIKKIDSSVNSVVIKGDTSAETIDGEESVILNLQYQYIVVLTDGTEWFILGGEYVKIDDILQKLLEEQQETSKKLEEINKKLEILK